MESMILFWPVMGLGGGSREDPLQIWAFQGEPLQNQWAILLKIGPNEAKFLEKNGSGCLPQVYGRDPPTFPNRPMTDSDQQ